MARIYLRKTLTGFVVADEASQDLARKFKAGEIYRADVVKPRNYKHHCLIMALLTLTFENQDRYTNFEIFRKAVAIDAGHFDEAVAPSGQIFYMPRSINYDTLDEVAFTKVAAEMMTVCCGILGNMNASELEAEVSRYASEKYGVAA